MNPTSVEFLGLKPWEIGSEIIYCTDTELGEVDLHNWSDLLAVEFDESENEGRGQVVFVFRDTRSDRPFRLTFHGVSGVELTRVDEGGAEDQEVFHAFDFTGNGRFSFESGRAYGELRATALSFSVDPVN